MADEQSRRSLLKTLAVGGALYGSASLAAPSAAPAQGLAATPDMRTLMHNGGEDRAYMLGLLEKMATPILSRMARGRLQAEWTPEVSPTWDGRDIKLSYLEALGRLLEGIAPWLALPDDDSPEGRLRKTLRDQALASITHAVDPKSSDYLLWSDRNQALVDSAIFSSALLRAPKALWEPLSTKTKQRVIAEIQGLRRVSPPYSNWLLFAAINEAFLLSVGAQWDPVRIGIAARKFDEWYVGDGWYGDGPRFHFDMYNSFVIHTMLAGLLDTLVATNTTLTKWDVGAQYKTHVQRMQRYAESLERMIGPDGAIPPIGRSLTYRTGAHQPLGYLAWKKLLPEKLPEGQVRAATLATQRRVFADPSNFDMQGFLTIGFTRHQPSLADVYSNAGSMYVAAASLLALGLPADDNYWTAPPQPWTMAKAYGGQDFPKDYYAAY